MANEFTLIGSVLYSDSEGTSLGLSLPAALQKTIATKRYTQIKMSVGTSDTVIPLGNISTLGYYLLINRDPVNPIDLKVASGGTIINRLDPLNGFAFGKFGSGVTAPAAIATTLACQMDGLIFSA